MVASNTMLAHVRLRQDAELRIKAFFRICELGLAKKIFLTGQYPNQLDRMPRKYVAITAEII